MQTFDASSPIYAWDNYPPEQFPPLWRWFARQIKSQAFTIPLVASEEIKDRAPECGRWLDEQHIKRIAITNAIVQEAFAIKRMLGIDGDRYSPKGVGENDLLIVAAAKVSGLELVSNEAVQGNLPKNRAQYKIPAVCRLPAVGVPCMDFITLIRQSREVFEGPGG